MPISLALQSPVPANQRMLDILRDHTNALRKDLRVQPVSRTRALAETKLDEFVLWAASLLTIQHALPGKRFDVALPPVQILPAEDLDMEPAKQAIARLRERVAAIVAELERASDCLERQQCLVKIVECGQWAQMTIGENVAAPLPDDPDEVAAIASKFAVLGDAGR